MGSQRLIEDRTLPAGWRCVRLGEVCEEQTGTRDPRSRPDDPFCYIDITSVDNISKRIVAPKRILGRDAPSRARQIVRAGDVLVATTRPNLNAVALVPPELDNEICSTGFCVLRPKPELCSHYLFGFVRSKEFVESLSSSVKGAMYPAVTDNQVRAEMIPLPPLAEQRRIAAILNEQMTTVQRARTAAEARLEAAKALPAAYLRAVFSSPQAQQWPRKLLGEVCDVVNGFGFAEQLQGHQNLPYPFIKVSDMNTEGSEIVVYGAANTVDSSILGALRAKTFPPGTVIFPKVGGALLTNKKRILGVQATFDNNIIGIIPKTVQSWWVFHWIQTVDLRELANTQALPSIRQSEVAALQIPFPPLADQQCIAAILNEQMASAERARKAIEEELETINKLPAALLRRAFNGEL